MTTIITIPLTAIDPDTTIQCRATIDMQTVNEYAERMTEGDRFPPVVLFGTSERAWIGDGWHRVMAARSIEVRAIEAQLRPGGRTDALKYALGANGSNGLRRTNADKRRCVEIALREFPKLSSRSIAELCGVGDDLVLAIRPKPLPENGNATRTTKDGRQYPAHRPVVPRQAEPEDEPEPAPSVSRPVLKPPCIGLQYARIAILNLERITDNDSERAEAFATVQTWLDGHRPGGRR